MARNYQSPGRTVTIPAPSDVASGDVVIVGSLAGIAAGDATTGDDLDLTLEGVFTLDKVASDAVTAGAPIYWNGSLATITATDNDRIGTAVEPAAASTGTVAVRLIQL